MSGGPIGQPLPGEFRPPAKPPRQRRKGQFELILVNHIGAESGPRRMFELAFAPLARRLGWRPEFPWERLTNWAARHGGVSLTERRPMPPMGHFSLIRFRKS